jgi:UDP:flavonoid glycosyltransferase YjiC (YdhE family)
MRVLVTASNWTGHYFAVIPLAWAAQAAGHEVRVACAPSQAAAVAAAGLRPAAALDGPDTMHMVRMITYLDAVETAAAGGPPARMPVHPRLGRTVTALSDFDAAAAAPAFWKDTMDATRRSCDGAVALARDWRPDLVLHDLTSQEGALAARVTGVPAVLVMPGLIGSLETDPALFLGPPDLTGSFPRYGVDPWHPDQVQTVIDPTPDEVAPPFGPARRLPVRYVPYNGAGIPPDWIARPPGGRRACVIWGNSATGMFGPDAPGLRAALAALRGLADEVVLTANAEQVAALGPLPGQVRVLCGCPLRLLLDHCDLVVHHGSVNCLMTALEAGVAQLALPLSAEQRAVSRRLARTGAVTVADGLAATKDELADCAAALLAGDASRQAATRLRAENAARPTPADLLGEIMAGAS